MPSFKDELKTKVPARYQDTPEFRILLKTLSAKRISSSGALKLFCDSEIGRCKEWLSKNKARETSNRFRKRYVQHWEFCKLIREKIVPYL